MKKQLGILCHVSSLNGDYGIGDFGKVSLNFIDFLADNGFKIWQILPLNETNEYNCPYASTCYFSIDEMFVDVEDLLKTNKIEESDVKKLKKLSKTFKVDYQNVKLEKYHLITKAFNNLNQNELKELEIFLNKNNPIKNYAYYKALQKEFNTKNFREISKEYWLGGKKFDEFYNKNYSLILRYAYGQYLLNASWQKVMKYAKSRGIQILGDLPIYPDPNSFDVFNDPNAFLLDKNLNPLVYGGVPGDDFTPDGQNWGTCVYNWNKLKQDKYTYMIQKLNTLLQRYHILRLDHFFGYTEHYEWDANVKNKGKWVSQDGYGFFKTVQEKCDIKKFVIEDLGFNKPTANEIKNQFNLRGMCVLQMCLESEANKRYLPQNVSKECLYYLGTHDNNTFIGYLQSLNKQQRQNFCNLIGIKNKNEKYILIECIKKMINSKSQTIIIQIQDLLAQNGKYRMNVPGRAEDCWEYKMPKNYTKKAQFVLNVLN